VDLSEGSLGPLASGKITSGHNFSSADSTSSDAVVDSNYASAQGLKTGSTIKIAGKKFTVIGIVTEAQETSAANVYIPLARAQSLAGMKNQVNTIYVSAKSASDIPAVSKEISAAMPKATVTTSSDLASEVTGSLSSASSLANNLGRWLAVAVLAAAFGLASLLTVSAVTRRVREFGTLKAIGWRNRRILRQIMGESLVIGLIGGAAGVLVGIGGAALIQAIAPPLTATTQAPAAGAAGAAGGPGGGFARAAQAATHTVSVHLTAPITIGAVLLAVALAVAGGLIAGSIGGWRAVRLRPAAALARVV
jgi:ABC-type antimicrobial peptide transport system permease subunit